MNPAGDILAGVDLIRRTSSSSSPVLIPSSGLGILPIVPSSSDLSFVLPHDRVGGWGLPFHGVAHCDCGAFFTLGCTLDHVNSMDYMKKVPNSCYRPSCPVCGRKWLARATARVVHRFKQYITKRKPIHVTASVPRASWHLSVEAMRHISYSKVKKVGLYGGCCIFHPFRQNEYTLTWYYSPHFHYVGFGWISKAGDEYRSSGWIVKNIGVRDSLEATVYYQLSHCGVWYGVGRRNSVNWFGSMSFNKLKVVPMPVVGNTCPEGHPLHRMVAVGVDLLPDEACEMWVVKGSYVPWFDNLIDCAMDRLGMAPTTPLSRIHSRGSQRSLSKTL